MRVLRGASNVWISILMLSTLLSAVVAGGWLALPMFASAPILRAAEPSDGARDVPVRTQISLRFDQPMNPRMVERAVRLSPPTPYTFSWQADTTTLIISPTVILLPSTDYRLDVETSALSRNLRSLANPITRTFRTVAAPAVLATIPAEGALDAPAAGALVVSFSRAMVSATALLQPAALPELQFDPPIAGRAIWVDQATLLFQPDQILLPGHRYRATINASLTDLGGGSLGQPVVWSFQTALPAVLAFTPANAARDVALRTLLTAHLSQPLTAEEIRAGLMISPTIESTISTTNLPDGTQAMTITPLLGWRPSTAYRAELRLREQPIVSWSFATAPRPALIGRFPGVGQILPPGQDIRLIFSTPVDPEALRTMLRFDPPALDLRVTGAGEEVRVAAKLRAGTAYTLTIPAELTDQSGTLLGTNYPIRFTTAPAQPAIALPEIDNRQASFAPGESAELLVRRTNLSALLIDLYDLDEATVIRTRVFGSADWQLFEPERYLRPLRRSWTVPLSDTLNTATEDRLALTDANGQPLPAGIYYVRIRTPEGPRADLLLTVSRTHLAFQFGATGGLVWATDAISGTVIANQPVALYQDDALILEGLTDQKGLLAFNLAGGVAHTYAALARGPQPGLVTAGPLTFVAPGLRDRYHLFLTSDTTIYHPGQAIRLSGFVRQLVTDTLSLPVNPPPLNIQLFGVDGRVLTDLRAAVDQRGLFVATLPLDESLPTGSYQVKAEIGGRVESLLLTILPQSTADFALQVRLPDGSTSTPPLAVLMAETNAGLPISGLPISWTLSAEAVAAPLPEGYAVGTGVFAAPAPRTGMGQTDTDGRLTIAMSETLSIAGTPLRYRLTARAAAANDSVVIGSASFVAPSANMYVGIRVRQQVLQLGSLADLELLAVDAFGRPQAQLPLRIELFRAAELNARPVLTRQVTSAADGTALISLPIARGGQYVVRASATDPQGHKAVSETSLWVAGTPASGLDRPLLIPDRASYNPGDTAVLLAQLPEARPAALITIARAATLTPEVREVRSGETFTVTLAASDQPEVRVTLLVPGVLQRPAQSVSTVLPVGVPATQPVLAITADRKSYLPGATATLTITTTDAAGQPLPADLLVSVVGDQVDQPVVYWSGPLRAKAGVQQLVLPLPDTPGQLRVVAVAATVDQVMRSEAALLLEEDVRVRFDIPSFVRPGDQFEITTQLVNTTPVTQTITLNLTADGVKPLNNGFAEQVVTLAAYERLRRAWTGVVEQRSSIRMQVVGRTSRGTASDTAERPVVTDMPLAVVNGGALVSSVHKSTITGDSTGGLIIDLAASPDAVALQVARTASTTEPRSLLDEAALLLLTAPLTETHELARTSIAHLVAAQSSDGGWGWWPQLRSQPVVTAVVLEAFAAARTAGLSVPERSRSLGLAWAALAVDDQSLALDLRAQLAYALGLHERLPINSVRTLAAAADTLGPEGAATLLLALPVSETQSRSLVLARLKALAVPDASGLSWPARTDTLGGATTTASWALLALQQADAEPTLRSSILATLASTRAPNGWSTLYATARAVIALRASWVPTPLPSRIAIELNGERLVEQTSELVTTTIRLELPAARLQATNLLTVTSVGSPILLSYRLAGAPITPARSDDMLLLRDEPQNGSIRLTLLVRQPLPFALLDIPLPPGAEVGVRTYSRQLTLVSQTPERLLFATDLLAPGVYEVRYQLRASAASAFQVPQPSLRSISGNSTISER